MLDLTALVNSQGVRASGSKSGIDAKKGAAKFERPGLSGLFPFCSSNLLVSWTQVQRLLVAWMASNVFHQCLIVQKAWPYVDNAWPCINRQWDRQDQRAHRQDRQQQPPWQVQVSFSFAETSWRSAHSSMVSLPVYIALIQCQCQALLIGMCAHRTSNKIGINPGYGGSSGIFTGAK